MADILAKLMQTWPARMAQDVWSGVTLPRDVYQGTVDPGGPEALGRVNALAALMVGSPLTPRGALGSSSTSDGFRQLLNAASDAHSNELTRRVIPRPLSLADRTWQNYASKLTNPDDVLQLDALWAAKSPKEFAALANDMWGRMGVQRQMTPADAQQYMATALTDDLWQRIAAKR